MGRRMREWVLFRPESSAGHGCPPVSRNRRAPCRPARDVRSGFHEPRTIARTCPSSPRTRPPAGSAGLTPRRESPCGSPNVRDDQGQIRRVAVDRRSSAEAAARLSPRARLDRDAGGDRRRRIDRLSHRLRVCRGGREGHADRSRSRWPARQRPRSRHPRRRTDAQLSRARNASRPQGRAGTVRSLASRRARSRHHGAASRAQDRHRDVRRDPRARVADGGRESPPQGRGPST